MRKKAKAALCCACTKVKLLLPFSIGEDRGRTRAQRRRGTLRGKTGRLRASCMPAGLPAFPGSPGRKPANLPGGGSIPSAMPPLPHNGIHRTADNIPATCLFSRVHRSESLRAAPLCQRFLTCTLEKTCACLGRLFAWRCNRENISFGGKP